MRLLDEKCLSGNIESIAQYDFFHNKVYGSAYFVSQENHLDFGICYGTDLLSGEKISRNTLFRLASMTKPVTAIATLILVDRGLLSLDDALEKYLPEFENIRIIDDQGNDCGVPAIRPTIRNILNHTSGIGSSEHKMQHMRAEDKESLDASIAFFVREGLDFEPSTMQRYSGIGAFDVLARIIEIVSNRTYLEFLTEEIFEPCNMVDTTFEPDAEQLGRLVCMHNLVEGKRVSHEMHNGCIYEDFPQKHYLGGAGLVSTLQDYRNFSQMLLNHGRFQNRQLLREDIFNLLCTPQVSSDIMPGAERWGLGVRVIAEETYPFLPVGTFGWSGAYGTHFWIDPANRIYAVFMKNSKFDGGSGNESAVNFERAVYLSLKR